MVETLAVADGRGSEYHLTPAGKDLEPVLIALGRWAVEWLYPTSTRRRSTPSR